MLKQRARVEWVREQMAALPLHASPDRDAVLEAFRSRAELLRKQASSSRRGRGGGGAEAEITGPGGSAVSGGTWRQFEAVGALLQQFGALDEWRATEFGELVMGLGGDNELWLALVMLELADKRNLQPQQLAAILGATLDERVRPNAYVGYFSSPEVIIAPIVPK